MSEDNWKNVISFPSGPKLIRQPEGKCITHAEIEAEVTQVVELWAQCDEIVASLDALQLESAEMLARVQRLRLERIVVFLKMLDTRQQIRMAEIAVRVRIEEARAAVAAHEAARAASGEAEVVSLSVTRIAADETLTGYQKLIAVHRAELAAARSDDERRQIQGLIAALEQLAASPSATTDESRRALLAREIESLIDAPDPRSDT